MEAQRDTLNCFFGQGIFRIPVTAVLMREILLLPQKHAVDLQTPFCWSLQTGALFLVCRVNSRRTESNLSNAMVTGSQTPACSVLLSCEIFLALVLCERYCDNFSLNLVWVKSVLVWILRSSCRVTVLLHSWPLYLQTGLHPGGPSVNFGPYKCLGNLPFPLSSD